MTTFRTLTKIRLTINRKGAYMTIYALMKRNIDYSVVNDDLDVVGGPPEELVALFVHEEDANIVKKQKETEERKRAEEFGCDEDEYFVTPKQLHESAFH